jgi:hypothetical protein
MTSPPSLTIAICLNLCSPLGCARDANQMSDEIDAGGTLQERRVDTYG